MIVSRQRDVGRMCDNRGTTKDGPGGATNAVIPGLATRSALGDTRVTITHSMPAPSDKEQGE